VQKQELYIYAIWLSDKEKIMRISINKSTGKLIESQSGGDELPLGRVQSLLIELYTTKYNDRKIKPELTPKELIIEFASEIELAKEEYKQENLNVLVQNAINAGYTAEDVEVRFVTDGEFQAILEAEKPKPTYADLRRAEYPSIQDMIVALWEDIIEGRPESRIALQEKRVTIKEKYPKP